MIFLRDGVMALALSLGVHGVFLWPAAGTHSAADPFDAGRTAVSVRFAPSIDSRAERSNPVQQERITDPADSVKKAAATLSRVEKDKAPAAYRAEQEEPAPAPPAEIPPLLNAAQAAKADAVNAVEIDGSLEEPGVTARAELLGVCRPSYPRLSRKFGEEGTVSLEVEIGSDGRTRKARLLQASGYKRLDASARHALEQALFQPARRSGAPVDSLRSFAFTFTLDDRPR